MSRRLEAPLSDGRTNVNEKEEETTRKKIVDVEGIVLLSEE
jgi:hypothetical protein